MNKRIISWIFVIWLSTFSSVVLQADEIDDLCLENTQRLAEISAQLQNNLDCNRLIEKANKINSTFFEVISLSKELKEFHDGFLDNYEKVLLKDFRALEKESDDVINEAAAKNLLLTPDKRKGKPVVSIFSATTFAREKDEATLVKLRVRQKEIFTKMLAIISSGSSYSQESKKQITNANKKRIAILERLKVLNETLLKAKNDLKEQIEKNRFPQCLGAMPPEGAERSARVREILTAFSLAGVRFQNPPSQEQYEQKFFEFKAPKLSLPDGTNLMLVASEVDLLVIEQLEAGASGDEQSLTIEYSAWIVEANEVRTQIINALEAVPKQLLDALTADELFIFSEKREAYLKQASAAALTAEAALATAKGVYVVGEFLVVGTVTSLAGGVEGLFNLLGRIPLGPAGAFDAVESFSLRFNEPVRPDVGDFDMSRRAGRFIYMRELKAYRSEVQNHTLLVRNRREQSKQILIDGIKVGLAALDAIGVKASGIAIKGLVKNLTTKKIKISALGLLTDLERAEIRRQRKAAIARGEISAEATVFQKTKLTAAEQKTIAQHKKSNLEKAAKAKADAASKTGTTTVAKEIDNFVPKGGVPPLEKFQIDGVVLIDVKFQVTNQAGTTKTLLKTNQEGYVGLLIDADTASVQLLKDTRVFSGQPPLTNLEAQQQIKAFTRQREETAVRLLADAQVDSSTVQIAVSRYTPDGKIKIAKKVDSADTFEARIRDNLADGNPPLNAGDRAVFQKGVRELNDKNLLWLDPNLGNASLGRNADGSTFMRIIDEDGIIKVPPASLENGILSISNSQIGEAKIIFDLNSARGIRELQEALLTGNLTNLQLNQIRQRLADGFHPISAGVSPLASAENLKEAIRKIDAAKAERAAARPAGTGGVTGGTTTGTTADNAAGTTTGSTADNVVDTTADIQGNPAHTERFTSQESEQIIEQGRGRTNQNASREEFDFDDFDGNGGNNSEPVKLDDIDVNGGSTDSTVPSSVSSFFDGL